MQVEWAQFGCPLLAHGAHNARRHRDTGADITSKEDKPTHGRDGTPGAQGPGSPVTMAGVMSANFIWNMLNLKGSTGKGGCVREGVCVRVCAGGGGEGGGGRGARHVHIARGTRTLPEAPWGKGWGPRQRLHSLACSKWRPCRCTCRDTQPRKNMCVCEGVCACVYCSARGKPKSQQGHYGPEKGR